MKFGAVILLLASTYAVAQTKLSPASSTRTSEAIRIDGDRIVLGSKPQRPNIIRLNDPNRPIRVSGTVIKEVETAAKQLYNIENKVAGIKLASKRRQFMNLTNHVGVKGWETKATGVLSKKRGYTFDFNYRFSFQDMLMNGQGHRLMLITKF